MIAPHCFLHRMDFAIKVNMLRTDMTVHNLQDIYNETTGR